MINVHLINIDTSPRSVASVAHIYHNTRSDWLDDVIAQRADPRRSVSEMDIDGFLRFVWCCGLFFEIISFQTEQFHGAWCR